MQYINGDFSGAVIDDVTREIIIFRDHMGVRPIYYYADDSVVLFSSDMRSLLAVPGVDAEINTNRIYKVSHGYSELRTEETEFAHIFCVKPACYVKCHWEKGRLKKTVNPYWKLGKKKIRLRSEEEYTGKLRELITDAVQRRLEVCSEPVGAELSGGLDSGVIDIIINRLGKKAIYFSWSLDPKDLPFAPNDERLIIEDICRQEQIQCYYGKQIIDLGKESNLGQSCREVGLTLDTEEGAFFQYAMPPYINTLAISETAQFVNRQGARVIFSGHGGDEGVSHRCSSYEMFHHHEYYHYFKYMWTRTRGQKLRIARTIKRCMDNIVQSRRAMRSAFREKRAGVRILRKEIEKNYSPKGMLKNTFLYDAKKYIQNGGSGNRLDNVALQGAYSGARYMMPYLDYRVIDFAVSIPRYLYLKEGMNRYIFREAFKDIMPNSLYTLRVKENNSRKMMKDEDGEVENRIKEYMEIKKRIVNSLDRTFWEKYLDYEIIDAWLNKQYTSEQDAKADSGLPTALGYCALVENMIKKAGSI